VFEQKGVEEGDSESPDEWARPDFERGLGASQKDVVIRGEGEGAEKVEDTEEEEGLLTRKEMDWLMGGMEGPELERERVCCFSKSKVSISGSVE